MRHGRLDRVDRGVYGPLPAGDIAVPAPGASLPPEPLAWQSPVAWTDGAAGDLIDGAVDPEIRHDPDRWSGGRWPAPAQAGSEWAAGPPDPFVVELVEELAPTVLATYERVTALLADRLGPPPPRFDPARPRRTGPPPWAASEVHHDPDPRSPNPSPTPRRPLHGERFVDESFPMGVEEDRGDWEDRWGGGGGLRGRSGSGEDPERGEADDGRTAGRADDPPLPDPDGPV